MLLQAAIAVHFFGAPVFEYQCISHCLQQRLGTPMRWQCTSYGSAATTEAAVRLPFTVGHPFPLVHLRKLFPPDSCS